MRAARTVAFLGDYRSALNDAAKPLAGMLSARGTGVAPPVARGVGGGTAAASGSVWPSIETAMLPARSSSPGGGEVVADLEGLTLDEAERILIVAALERCGNNVSAAARELGITRMAMRYRMKKYALEQR